MLIFSNIIGNAHTPEWQEILHDAHIESIHLDQWSAQKSRFMATSDHGREYAVALKRHTHIADGDIVYYSTEHNHAVVLRLQLSEVMVIDTSAATKAQCFELGHAIGNQHWPAIIKAEKVYVPMTVDKKVMNSVMHTHNFGLAYKFESGDAIIPYLSPHEERLLFGGPTNHEH
jgi:urease accessory protein